MIGLIVILSYLTLFYFFECVIAWYKESKEKDEDK